MMTIEDQKPAKLDSQQLGYRSQKALENYEQHKIEWNKILKKVKNQVPKTSSVMDRDRTIQMQLKNIEK